jgi:hypothetical protein
MNKVRYSPSRIFNVDEIDIIIVHGIQEKVVRLRGEKQLATITSAERGNLFTVNTCIDAAGTYLPPTLIFPMKNIKP